MTSLNSIHLEIILYCKGHIQMTSNYSNVNVEIEKNYCKQNLNINSTHLDITNCSL